MADGVLPLLRARDPPHDEERRLSDCQRDQSGGPDTGRPVIVYLYGGGNRTGSASLYPGAPLIGRSDAVFVNFNFRIGVLGLLDLAGPDAGGWFDSNLALRDQLTALSWVQQNIAAFGGDPDSTPAVPDRRSADSCSTGRTCARSAGPGPMPGRQSSGPVISHPMDRGKPAERGA